MIQNYTEDFKQLTMHGPSWFESARKDSFARFSKQGFPTTRMEEWKDTNLSSVTTKHFSFPVSASKYSVPTQAFWKNSPHVIFYNGFCAEIPTALEGCTIQSLKDGIANSAFQSVFGLKPSIDHAFYDLNTSLVQEGVTIQIHKNASLQEPIYLVYISDSNDQAHYYRNLILVESNAKAKVVEIYLQGSKSGTSWTLPVTQIQLSTNAQLEHIKVQDESATSFHTGVIAARLLNDSKLQTYSFALGAQLSRNDIQIDLDGEGAECGFEGLYIATQNQVMDHHTIVNHSKPHCSSSEIYKGVLADEGHGIFEGKVIVREGAQKTDARQMNQNLILSSTARVNTAPQLEILADDVKCSHGATIGKLDEDQLFYLRSRGIDSETARRMLVNAYAEEIITKVSIPSIVEMLQQRLTEKL